MTQLYLHNVKFNVSVNVFAPMVPVPKSNIIPSPRKDGQISIQVSTKGDQHTVQSLLLGSPSQSAQGRLQYSLVHIYQVV